MVGCKYRLLVCKLVNFVLFLLLQASYEQQTIYQNEVVIQYPPYARILQSDQEITGQFILDSLNSTIPQAKEDFGKQLFLQKLDTGYDLYLDITNMQDVVENRSVIKVIAIESEQQSGPLEGQLRQFLLQGYDRTIYPWSEYNNEPVGVSIKLNVHKVLDLELAFGELTLLVWYTVSWRDPRLTWNPEEWNNISKLFFQDDEIYSSDEIWDPNIELWNAHQPLEENMYPQPFTVTEAGEVTWIRFGDIGVSCDMKGLHSFPYDQTECNLEFGSWIYDGSLVYLNLSQSGFDIGGSLTSSNGSNKYAQYDLQEHLLEVQQYIYNTDHDLNCLGPKGWPVLVYHIVLSRQPTQYTAKIFVPQLVLTLLSFGAFWLSPECGERIGLVITIPLANAVYDLVVFEELPDSNQMVFAAAFGLGNFAFSMFVVVESLVVLLLWEKRDPYMAAPWKSLQKLLQDYYDQGDWVVIITAVEEYLFKLARFSSKSGSKKLDKNHKFASAAKVRKFEYFMETLRVGLSQKSGSEQQNGTEVVPVVHLSKDSIADAVGPSNSGENSTSLTDSQTLDQEVQIHSTEKLLNSLSDFQTREDVRKFIQSIKKYQVDIKGRKYVQQAFDRLEGRHGEVAIEQRIVSLLAVKDEDDDFMGANLKNVRAEAAEEYMLKWRMVSKLLDRACQLVILPIYVAFLATFVTILVKSSQEHVTWFQDLTTDYETERASNTHCTKYN